MQASLKKFMDYIQTSAVDKMIKFIDKGLDPNFQDSDTGGKDYYRAKTPVIISRLAFYSCHFIHWQIFLSYIQ